MNRFEDATYDQLDRLVKIIDKKMFSCDILFNWAFEGEAQPEYTTEETIRYWEGR